MEIEINGQKIGPNYPPYVIAELSANHNGDLGRALNILEEAKRCGADAVKLQTYTADTITMKSDRPEFQIKGGLWDGHSLYELYEWAHMPWEWHKPLFEKAAELGITIFSSPFDYTAIDFLEKLEVPAYKIASFEVIDLPLIRRVAQTGKPIIISTGMASLNEIEDAITTARDNGCGELVVLHCVSGYPAPPADYNLRTLLDISEKFSVLTGLSDHTISNTTAIASVALGACVIEKHLTLDRSAGGPDDSFSLEPKELEWLCNASKEAWEALGKADYTCKKSEKENMNFRRSLYVVNSVEPGDLITPDNVRSIRPGNGLPPREYDHVMEKTALQSIESGTPLSWDLLS